MTKHDLVYCVSRNTGNTMKDVSTVVDSFLEQIEIAISSGKDVTLRGFGTFRRHKRANKVARDINNGNTPIFLEAQNTVKFKPSKVFKDKVN